MLFHRWMKFGVLYSALFVLPAQSAFAVGGQWRPINSVAPLAHSNESRLQRSAAHARFRPLNHLRQPQQLPTLAAPAMPRAPMAPPHLTRPMAPLAPMAPQAPAFARQYAWRPASTGLVPHRQVARQQARQQAQQARHQQQAQQARHQQQVQQARHQQQVRQARSNMLANGSWRPVSGEEQAVAVARSVPATTGYSRATSHQQWRPVATGYAESQRGFAGVNHQQVLPVMPVVRQMPVNQRAYMPSAYGYGHPVHRYAMPAPVAYRPQPYYSMPYMPLPHYASPYSAYNPMVRPMPRTWGWQPPVMPLMPARMYPPQVPSLSDEGSLAGCPGC